MSFQKTRSRSEFRRSAAAPVLRGVVSEGRIESVSKKNGLKPFFLADFPNIVREFDKNCLSIGNFVRAAADFHQQKSQGGAVR